MALKTRCYYVLLALAEADKHGLAIARDVLRLSDGAMRLWPATLYGTLEELLERGLIKELGSKSRPDDNERRRYYAITRSGRAALDNETRRLGELVRLARAISRRQDA
jgi:DNA-binding PadR family transcriptional regulator